MWLPLPGTNNIFYSLPEGAFWWGGRGGGGVARWRGSWPPETGGGGLAAAALSRNRFPFPPHTAPEQYKIPEYAIYTLPRVWNTRWKKTEKLFIEAKLLHNWRGFLFFLLFFLFSV